MSRFAQLALAGVLLVAIAACAGGGASTAQPTAPAKTAAPSAPSNLPPSSAPTDTSATAITIDKFEFAPARLTVNVGDTVTWTNEEDSLHTVSSGTPYSRTGLFDSGEFDTGETFEYTFAAAGTYAFFCDRHEFMRGEVIVVP